MITDLARTVVDNLTPIANAIPGETADQKIELVANVLGIAGFVMSLGLVMFGWLARRGRRRPATQGDLESLSRAVVEMTADRIAAQLAQGVSTEPEIAAHLDENQISSTAAQVKADITAAVTAVASARSDDGKSASAALLRGETGMAEQFLELRADNSASSNPASAAGDLHLAAALRSTHDLEGALHACTKALNIHPNDALGWSRLAHLYLRLGRAEDARWAFDKAVALQDTAEGTALRLISNS